MKQNDWTSKLHERLDGHKATVPDGLWDKIATRLDDDNTALKTTKRNLNPIKATKNAVRSIGVRFGAGSDSTD